LTHKTPPLELETQRAHDKCTHHMSTQYSRCTTANSHLMSYYYYHHLPTIYATNTTNTGRPLSSPDQISRLSHTARAISVNPIALVCPRKKLLKEEWWVKRSGEERDYPVHMLS